MNTTGFDVAVIGSGPAGMAMACACAERGLSTAIVAPHPTRPWPQRYGVWASELSERPEAQAYAQVFSRPFVQVDDDLRFDLAAGYARLDTHVLQTHLTERARAAEVQVVPGSVHELAHRPGHSQLRLRDEGPIEARIVIDASGAASPFVRREGEHEAGFQAAYGEVVEVSGHPYAPDEMALMDFCGDDGGPPTFLYAMPLSERRLFVEETSLVGRPAVPYDALRERLHRRLARMHIEVGTTLDRELCLIPMGGPLPLRNQRVVAFGAAGGMVHPATGYQVARALTLAPAAAEALLGGLSVGSKEAARRAYEAIWPNHQLRAWELYRFGMLVLCDLDRTQLRAFMDAFFRLPPAKWQGFMQGSLSPTEICSAMWQVFGFATSDLRQKLLAMGTNRRGSRLLLRAALPGNPL